MRGRGVRDLQPMRQVVHVSLRNIAKRGASMHGRRSVDEAVGAEMTTCAHQTCANPCGEIQAPCEECDAVVCDEHWVWVDGRGVVCVGCLGEGDRKP